jgi:phospholipid-binding lipoprotein MlaA
MSDLRTAFTAGIIVVAAVLVLAAGWNDTAAAASSGEFGLSDGQRRLALSQNAHDVYDGSAGPRLRPAVQLAFLEGVKERKSSDGAADKALGDAASEETPYEISDPIEPWNRLMFHFNDKMYFWVLKPVGGFYAFLVPENPRRGVRNFFHNLTMPVRFVNSILQLKFDDAATELERFGINSTLGIFGLGDVAKKGFGIERADRDFGQTLGKYGLGSGFYIVWPFVGPLSARDTLGFAGDYFLDPVTYVQPFESSFEVRAYSFTNDVSLRIGDYEDFKKDALDPYTALKDAYFQYRRNKIGK